MTDLPTSLRAGAPWARRDLARALGAMGLGLAALPVTARAATEASYFTWAGYDVPEMHVPYTTKHGASPTFTIFADEAEALSKVQAGFAPDIAHPCIYDVIRWRDAGVIRPIDSARIAAWDDLYPELKAVSGNQETGEQWLIPFDWGNGSVLYRTDLVDPKYLAEESWSILFDEQYAGRLAMWGAPDGAVNAAALVAGVADPFNMTEDEQARVRELLVKQKGLLRFYWDDPAQAEQALASGEIVAAYTWNASLVNLTSQGVPVKYMTPKEGILTWVCGLVMLNDGPADDDAKYDFINSMLDPQTGFFLLDSYGYGHSNSKSFELLAPGRLAELGLPENPADMFKSSVVLKPMDPDVRTGYIRMLEEVMAGA